MKIWAVCLVFSKLSGCLHLYTHFVLVNVFRKMPTRKVFIGAYNSLPLTSWDLHTHLYAIFYFSFNSGDSFPALYYYYYFKIYTFDVQQSSRCKACLRVQKINSKSSILLCMLPRIIFNWSHFLSSRGTSTGAVVTGWGCMYVCL